MNGRQDNTRPLKGTELTPVTTWSNANITLLKLSVEVDRILWCANLNRINSMAFYSTDTCMTTSKIKTGRPEALRLAHAPPTQHLQEGAVPTA